MQSMRKVYCGDELHSMYELGRRSDQRLLGEGTCSRSAQLTAILRACTVGRLLCNKEPCCF
ncbi:hypothetical protein T01_3688 [Trichinella spiralis]|uniref:Uncharacterized protein n=1 Tax=Trichinella spiralis TaxID=6334 RepID=A0A0V1B8V0_TRISP|nr:hypothetical protein T01_3688 [Trichinella spiralis]